MKYFYSKNQSSSPRLLDILREINYRQALTPFMERKLYQLEKIDSEINKILTCIQQSAPSHWIVLTDLSYCMFSYQRCSIILITDYSVHIIQNNLNPNKFIQHSIEESENIAWYYRHALKELDFTGILESLVVTDTNSNDLYKSTSDTKVIPIEDLGKYFEKIAKKEAANALLPQHSSKIVNLLLGLDSHRTPDVFTFERPSLDQVSKGIKCQKCHCFNLLKDGDFIFCVCSHYELYQYAIIRTINEYGKIFGTRVLCVDYVYEFFNGGVTKEALKTILEKNFLKSLGRANFK